MQSATPEYRRRAERPCDTPDGDAVGGASASVRVALIEGLAVAIGPGTPVPIAASAKGAACLLFTWHLGPATRACSRLLSTSQHVFCG